MKFLISGGVYMQVDEERKLGRIVDPEEDPTPYPWTPLESMFAHVHTNEAWLTVKLDQVSADIREAAKLESPLAPM